MIQYFQSAGDVRILGYPTNYSQPLPGLRMPIVAPCLEGQDDPTNKLMILPRFV